MDFVADIKQSYTAAADTGNAAWMTAYMKNNFEFIGLKTNLRRELQKKVIGDNKKELQQQPREIALQLYSLPMREYHYCAIEILIKQLNKKFIPGDIELIEYLITTNSWWDSVDTLSKYLLGGFLTQYPDAIPEVTKQFSNSENMWLNRSAILFQLGYKNDTDKKLLYQLCEMHCNSKEFFIQKAIGWALREYAKVNPSSVHNFVEKTTLKPLSKREALKHL